MHAARCQMGEESSQSGRMPTDGAAGEGSSRQRGQVALQVCGRRRKRINNRAGAPLVEVLQVGLVRASRSDREAEEEVLPQGVEGASIGKLAQERATRVVVLG